MKEFSDILKLVVDLGTPVVLLFVFVFYFGKMMNKQSETLQSIEKQLVRIYEVLKINNKQD